MVIVFFCFMDFLDPLKPNMGFGINFDQFNPKFEYPKKSSRNDTSLQKLRAIFKTSLKIAN